MANKWQQVSYGDTRNPGCFDTGNGGIATVSECSAYPGIEKVVVTFYARDRGPDYTYYRRAEDANGAFVRTGAPSWRSIREAVEGRLAGE